MTTGLVTTLSNPAREELRGSSAARWEGGWLADRERFSQADFRSACALRISAVADFKWADAAGGSQRLVRQEWILVGVL